MFPRRCQSARKVSGWKRGLQRDRHSVHGDRLEKAESQGASYPVSYRLPNPSRADVVPHREPLRRPAMDEVKLNQAPLDITPVLVGETRHRQRKTNPVGPDADSEIVNPRGGVNDAVNACGFHGAIGSSVGQKS